MACGSDDAVSQGSLEGGSGGRGEAWEPEEPDDPESSAPEPETLAMAYEDGRPRLVSLAGGGVFEPYGPLLPTAPDDAPFVMLEWKPAAGRGAVLRRSDTASSVVFIDHGELTEVQRGAPRVQRIELSREALAVVLHHDDKSTTVVDGDGRVVLEVEARPTGRENWLAFSDGDRWVTWSRDVAPSAFFGDLDYWLHDFDTGRTRHLVTWPSSVGAHFSTFRHSILRYDHDSPADTRWLDVEGGDVTVDIPYAELTFGPGRHVFARDRAYRLTDGALEDLGPQVLPPGHVHRFEPGRYVLVETEDTLAYVDAEGQVLYEDGIEAFEGVGVGPVPDDPDDLSVVLSLTSEQSDGVLHPFTTLWRPEAAGSEREELIRFGEDDPELRRTTRFAPDGTLVSVFSDDTMTVVDPDADDETPIESPYRIAGFHYAGQ